MWKPLLGLLFISPAWSQVFTEDISKINHFIAEEEVKRVSESKTPQTIPAEYLRSLVHQKYLDPLTACDEFPRESRPKNVRYEVLMVSEDVPTEIKAEPKTTVVVAKYELQEEDSEVVKATKKILESQADNPGKFEISFAEDAGTKLINFASSNTSVVLNSNLKAENGLTTSIDPVTAKPTPVSATLQLDVVNRLDVKQVITSDSELKASIESQHSTGRADVRALKEMSLQLHKVKAEVRLDNELSSTVKTYTAVNYSGNNFDQDVKVLAGLDIKAPNNAEILIFTGQTSRYHGLKTAGLDNAKKESEIGVQYKTKRGVKFFGRVRNGSEKNDTVYETGLEIDLGK